MDAPSASSVSGNQAQAREEVPRDQVSASGQKQGIEQIEHSFKMLHTSKIDLMQIHSLKDWQTHAATLRDMKEHKRFRYIGITHSQTSAHAELEEVMRAEKWDWVQLNYSIQTRNAEERSCRSRRSSHRGDGQPAVRGWRDLQARRGQALPAWAENIGCTSWGQFFLKYVVSHPAVTCVIPATRVRAPRDNLQAGRGVIPEQNWREEMVRYFEAHAS